MPGFGKKTPRRKPARRLRSLHRWAGLLASAFLLLLCISGIALNHTSGLGLDSRFIHSPWLLSLYGINSPDITNGYLAGTHWVSLVEDRIFLDGNAVPGVSVDELAGAVAQSGETIVASPDELFFLTDQARLADRLPLGPRLPGPIEAIALSDASVALLSGNEVFAIDTLTGVAAPALANAPEPQWVIAEPVPDSLRSEIVARHQGAALTVERVVTDLHSGRLLGLTGVLVMDLAAVALAFLAVSGVVLFLRR